MQILKHETPAEALKHICEGLLDDAAALTQPVLVGEDELPASYRQLLAHTEHMTLRLPEYHGQPVRLKVLQESVTGHIYRREIVLLPENSDSVVEVGIVRLDLDLMPENVREEILARETPLGDILIRNEVLRRIEPRWYLRFEPGSHLLLCFGHSPQDGAFGRIGTIYCDDEPAIELLEIVTDLKGGA